LDERLSHQHLLQQRRRRLHRRPSRSRILFRIWPHWDQLSHSWLSSGDAARIDEALRRPIPRIQFDRVPLETVIKGLSQLSGVPIAVDLDSRGESYSFDSGVSLDLHDAPKNRPVRGQSVHSSDEARNESEPRDATRLSSSKSGRGSNHRSGPIACWQPWKQE
jgi:hypothetical protein